MRRRILTLFIFVLALVAILGISSGCSDTTINTTQPTTYFPVQKEAFNAYPLGLLRGQLVLENGCLRIQRTAGGGSNLIIWPYGYSLDAKGSKFQVLNEKGQPLAIVGDEVFVGGGLEPEDYLKKLISQPLPDGIGGPYWLAAPSFQDIPFELALGSLPVQRDIQIDYPLSTVEGTLILDNGYLILDTGNGKSVSPIWPPGSSCRIINYVLHVVDKTGQSVAGVGDKITINGAELPPEMLGKYAETYGPPEDFKRPYWLVTNVIGNTSAVTPIEPQISATGVSIRGQTITFQGTAALLDGKNLQSQLYEESKPLDWWPSGQDIQVLNGNWQITVQLGKNGAPDNLQTGPGYFFKVWSKDNPEIMATFYFDLVGPPILKHPIDTTIPNAR